MLTAPAAIVIVVVENVVFPKKYQNGDHSKKFKMCPPCLHAWLGIVFILNSYVGRRP